jgi:erythromycin esterase
MRIVVASVLGAVLLGLPGRALRADRGPATIGEEARVAWLKEHAAPLRSIDPGDEDFSDLEPLRKAIGDARIVQLSEQSHGDGATFLARTRLIKFLHQKCGFDLLAFESGLYDCRKAWQLLHEGKMPPREAVSQGVFGIWTGSEQVQPLIEYLGRQARRPRALEVFGFDCQFSGPGSSRHLPQELEAVLRQVPTETLGARQREAAVAGCRRLPRAGTVLDGEPLEGFAACRRALAAMKPTAALPAPELAFWRQLLESMTALAEVFAAAAERPQRVEHYFGTIRDAQVARNLVWLAREAYPRRKILVWAHARHLMRNSETVKSAANVLSEGSYRIDPAARPRAIDVTITQGAYRGQILQGIYDLDADTLRVCLAMKGGPRPTEMVSKPGSGYTLTVHRLIKKQ